GKASVAYIPDGKVVGLSKLARTVDLIARKPQIQEKMTAEVADALMKYLKPKGAIVIIEAEHMCMTMRGIKKPGSKTVTMAARGEFETNTELKDDFFRLLNQ
ncbi:MAG: GTP cyclohydrolase I, partial [Lachnospiraceae bacterium]|nr:GTP cyclohydrolase I [Lachnospiraceae bacterium]